MLPREVLIWKNWLRSNESRFSDYEYNFRVGEGADPGEGYSPDMRANGMLNSMKRVDAVAWTGNSVTLIEVEDRPGLSNFGQIVAYGDLFVDYARRRGPTNLQHMLGVDQYINPKVPFDAAPRLMLVCNVIGADAFRVLEKSHVKVEVVPTDFSSLKSS